MKIYVLIAILLFPVIASTAEENTAKKEVVTVIQKNDTATVYYSNGEREVFKASEMGCGKYTAHIQNLLRPDDTIPIAVPERVISVRKTSSKIKPPPPPPLDIRAEPAE